MWTAEIGWCKAIDLFADRWVDLMRPSVGFAAVKLLEDAGCGVVVPAQTCCGQPAYNSGDKATTRDIAWNTILAFDDCGYVVAPSGSCGGMLARHYPELFAGEPERAVKANAFAAKCHELVSFLVDVMKVSLSRFLFRPARTGRCGAAAPAARLGRRLAAGRA